MFNKYIYDISELKNRNLLQFIFRKSIKNQRSYYEGLIQYCLESHTFSFLVERVNYSDSLFDCKIILSENIEDHSWFQEVSKEIEDNIDDLLIIRNAF